MKQELERIQIPDEHGARERSWAVVSAAFAEREPQPRRRSWKPVAAVALAVVVVAGLLSPPGRAVLDEIRQVVGVEGSAPALFSLPAPGRLLVTADSGVWVVDEDGSKRLLGDYREASWSPFGRFVVATRANELVALTPDGTVRWSLARPDVRLPRWGGSRTDTRIAYFSARAAAGRRRRRQGRSPARRRRRGARSRVAAGRRPPARVCDARRQHPRRRRRHRRRDRPGRSRRACSNRRLQPPRRTAAGRSSAGRTRISSSSRGSAGRGRSGRSRTYPPSSARARFLGSKGGVARPDRRRPARRAGAAARTLVAGQADRGGARARRGAADPRRRLHPRERVRGNRGDPDPRGLAAGRRPLDRAPVEPGRLRAPPPRERARSRPQPRLRRGDAARDADRTGS